MTVLWMCLFLYPEPNDSPLISIRLSSSIALSWSASTKRSYVILFSGTGVEFGCSVGNCPFPWRVVPHKFHGVKLINSTLHVNVWGAIRFEFLRYDILRNWEYVHYQFSSMMRQKASYPFETEADPVTELSMMALQLMVLHLSEY